MRGTRAGVREKGAHSRNRLCGCRLVLFLPLILGVVLSFLVRECAAGDAEAGAGQAAAAGEDSFEAEQRPQLASPEVLQAVGKLLAVNPSEKFLWYSPHSGFGNQLIQLRHALRVAGLLNRTLIVPPVLRHFDVWLGRCEQRSARHPDVMRVLSWRSITRLLKSQHYLSMGDIVDLSGLSRSLVRTIDLRLFVATRCGLNITLALTSCAWCGPLLQEVEKIPYPQMLRDFEGNLYQRCGRLLGSLGKAMNLPTGNDFLVSQVRRSCRETIWTYGRTPTGQLSSEFRTWNLTGSGSCPGGLEPPHFEHQYIRDGLAYIAENSLPQPEAINLVSFMGQPGTPICSSKIVTLGSTMHYFDLEFPLGEPRADKLSCDTAFLPFVRPIMKFAQDFARSESGVGLANQYLCAHYRGSDGAFSEVRDATINVMVEKLKAALPSLPPPTNPKQPLRRLFLMTDMRTQAWRQRLALAFGEAIGYEVHFPHEFAEIKSNVTDEVFQAKYGLFSNRLHKSGARALLQKGFPAPSSAFNPNATEPYSTWGGVLRDVGVFLEQGVCACAPWHFIGQPDSTISEAIHHLRSGQVCQQKYNF